MQLPIDVKALIDEATDIKSARSTELSVSVYVDDTAPAELVAHVRGAFASTEPNVRMALSYLNRSFVPQVGDDIAIVVAGDSLKVGAAAKAMRAVGTPTMVVALDAAAVYERAEATGSAIPEGDVVSPFEEAEEEESAEGKADEARVFDGETVAALDDRMGRWIVAVCREKRLAFAIAFPFMRRPLACDAVQATSLQNAGIGLVPLIPGADLPILTLNQAKMVLQIAAAYGHEMDKDRIKELLLVVGGAYLCRTLARELAEFIPGLGFAIRAGVAYGGTAAIGYAVIEYFEGGENATGVANVAARAAETGTKFVSKARDVAADPKSLGLMNKISGYVPVVRDKVNEYAPVIRDAANEYIPKIADAAADIMSKAVAAK